MHSKINIHNFWRSHTFIVLMFVVMSVMSSIIMWHSHSVLTSEDFYFHWQRIYEMKSNIENGNVFSLVMLNMFNQTGTAVLASYPVLNLIPIVILSFFIKNVVSLIYLIFFLRNFFALVIGYWASYTYNASKKISFLFTTVYTLNTTVLFHAIYMSDLGRSSSLIFLPLILFGFLKLLNSNKWAELTIGMSLIILCHVINSVISIMFICCFILFNLKKFNDREILKSLFKFIVVTFLITSIFWLPFLMVMTHNQISMPLTSGTYLNGEPIWTLLSSLGNRIRPSLSLIALLGLIIGILNFKRMNSNNKQLFWISIIFLVPCFNIFPWHFISRVFPFVITTLQFPWRFFIIPQLLLSYIFSVNMFILSNSEKKKIYILAIFSLVALFTQLLGQNQIVNMLDNSMNVETYFNKTTSGKSMGQFRLENNVGMKLLSNNPDNVVIDYYPQSAIKYSRIINHHLVTYGLNYHSKAKSLENGIFVLKVPKNINNLSLPFLYYKGIDYQVKLDGKSVKNYANKDSLMTINNVHKGSHRIQIAVHKTKFEIASYIFSLIGVIVLLWEVIKKFKK